MFLNTNMGCKLTQNERDNQIDTEHHRILGVTNAQLGKWIDEKEIPAYGAQQSGQQNGAAANNQTQKHYTK